jgi:hypothetical protein
MPDITIKLGPEEFKISGLLTVRQSRDLRIGDYVAANADDGVGGWNNVYDTCIKTIAVAIREAYPDVKEEDLWNMRVSEDELGEARRAILQHAGFQKPEPTIAQLRSDVITKEKELEEIKKSLAARELKAKETGE